MNANEFIQSIYKGENLDMCEEHLKAFCKAKVQELIPEHFEQIQKYKEMIAAQNAAHDSFNISESAGSSERDIIKALKSKYRGPSKFLKIRDINFDFEDGEDLEMILDFEFPEDEGFGDIIDDIEDGVSKALKGLKVQNMDGDTFVIKSVEQDPNITTRGDPEEAIGFVAKF